MKKLSFAVILIMVGFAAGFYSYAPYREWQRERSQRARFLDKQAPDFATTTIDGLPWQLEDARGKVVLVEFWATWCPDCTAAIPMMKEIHEQYAGREDFLTLGVSLDSDVEKLRKMVTEKGLKWPQLFEEGKKWDNSVAVKFDIRWIPSIWVVDKKGITRGMNLHEKDEIVEALGRAFDS
jgi:thiol-disulfide isomerase/thioredoxin